MTVQPQEPVSYRWILSFPTSGTIVDNIEWPWDWSGVDDEETVKDALGDDAMLVYLANGQRIIVRALSEERKAARRARKAADRACYEAAYALARSKEREGFYGKGQP
jgi:hypothetical protein